MGFNSGFKGLKKYTSAYINARSFQCNSCFIHHCVFPSQPNLSLSHNRPDTRYYPLCPRHSINVCCVTTVTTQCDTEMVVGASRLKPLSQPSASIFRGILSEEESWDTMKIKATVMIPRDVNYHEDSSSGYDAKKCEIP